MGDDTRLDLEFLSNALAEAVKNRSERGRVQAGMQRRAEMHAGYQQGQPAHEYRMKWLQQTAEDTIEFARQACLKFDQEHPEDGASILDLLDIFQSALSVLHENLKAMQGP